MPRHAAAILELAVAYGHLDRNPAKGGRRRLPSVQPRRTFLDRAEQIAALLDATRELDGARRSAGRTRSCSATSTGGKQSATNVRRRVLMPAVERASDALTTRGSAPMPDGLTPHSLRRTFASILVARGEDPAYVMAQMGHTTPNLTLSLYARAMQRRDGERERLRALVDGVEWAPTGTGAAVADVPGG